MTIIWEAYQASVRRPSKRESPFKKTGRKDGRGPDPAWGKKEGMGDQPLSRSAAQRGSGAGVSLTGWSRYSVRARSSLNIRRFRSVVIASELATASGESDNVTTLGVGESRSPAMDVLEHPVENASRAEHSVIAAVTATAWRARVLMITSPGV